MTYNGRSLPGLGLNIARYNLGACSWNSVGGETMVKSPNIPAFKQIEGFWQDWNNEDPASSAWKWTADANQRAMLVKATQRGAITELFANSPMWWMCSNHNPSGAAGGGNNLQTWNYRQHASHLAATALYAKNNWGVNFATVDPFNEPASTWWTATGTQEGCHMDPAVQAAVLPYMRSELDKRGLTGLRIAASDETNYDTARSTWSSFNSSTKALVSPGQRARLPGLGRPPRPPLHGRGHDVPQEAVELRDGRQRRHGPDPGLEPLLRLPLAAPHGLVLLAGHGPVDGLGDDRLRREHPPADDGPDQALRAWPSSAATSAPA